MGMTRIATITERVILRLLSEGAPRLPRGAAALVYEESGGTAAVVYDTATAHKEVLGYIKVQKPEDPCNGAWEVKVSAGPGFGKVLYGLGYAMTPWGRLIPDRGAVSRSAQGAWDKVAGTRRKRLPLDDVDNPRTKTKKDDCIVWGDTNLDNAYEVEGWEYGMLDKLVAAHEKDVGRNKTLTRGQAEDMLRYAGEKFAVDHISSTTW